jgi:hypothetical protein
MSAWQRKLAANLMIVETLFAAVTCGRSDGHKLP